MEVVEKEATIDKQFTYFARLLDSNRSGTTMTLWRSDYWLRQADLMEDRRLTMTDTGVIWFKFGKTELTFNEWRQFLNELCETKNFDQEYVEDVLANCGIPSQVNEPQYRSFFDNYRPKLKLIY
ncbi:unnamed protein product [Arctia plantaginis]|uniref:Uncharacterized protein n=1 Tax=Arctia plantaginis TaxID=874455 RepID=A0A8S1BGA9_ARCPL|nr:unnamed protein product [Arctia plantaginis]